MRDDLLDAYGAIDWARSQIPVVQKEFESWRDAPAYLLIEEPRPEIGQKLFKLEINRPLPPALNAHVGAIINSTRTSLDILASTIAVRNGKTPHRERHFPIYDSLAKFIDPASAKKREKLLTAGDIKIIESLKPYDGGDNLIFPLHHLDVVRKHERLVTVQLLPTQFIADPFALRQGLQFPAQWPGFKHGAVIAWTSIHATYSEFRIPAEIAFAEAPLSGKPVAPTLRQFVGTAESIIRRWE